MPRTLYGYALGFALVEANLAAAGQRGPWPDDELSRMRRVTEMVPREAPDHPLRLAMLSAASATWASSSA
ncbi:MAG: hypothetical protein ACRDNZ_09715, partial [Streptosporangiaceae bacterium]